MTHRASPGPDPAGPGDAHYTNERKPMTLNIVAVLFLLAFFFGLVALFNAIQDPDSRKEMGVRLPEDDQ